tara:strand:+ start:236 stop:451 length:216 start_codon:yes stop_codon:yes gene_type:complete
MDILSYFDMAIIVDLFLVTFCIIQTWKIKKIEKHTFENSENLNKKVRLLREDLDLTMKNPQAGRRLLKQRK